VQTRVGELAVAKGSDVSCLPAGAVLLSAARERAPVHLFFFAQLVHMVRDIATVQHSVAFFCCLHAHPRKVQEAVIACWCLSGGVIAFVRSNLFWHLECSPHNFQLFRQE
jgi:hypothetical protein